MLAHDPSSVVVALEQGEIASKWMQVSSDVIIEVWSDLKTCAKKFVNKWQGGGDQACMFSQKKLQ